MPFRQKFINLDESSFVTSMSTLRLDQLPYELIAEIFSYLPQDDLINIRLVNRNFYWATLDVLNVYPRTLEVDLKLVRFDLFPIFKFHNL